MRVYSKAVSEGSIDGKIAELAAYGIYLANGGTREAFAEMTPDEVQLMFTTHMAMMRRQADMIAMRVWQTPEERHG